MKMKRDLRKLIGKTLSVKDYIMEMDEPFKSRFIERMKSYRLNEDIAEKLKKYADKILIAVFSAKWFDILHG